MSRLLIGGLASGDEHKDRVLDRAHAEHFIGPELLGTDLHALALGDVDRVPFERVLIRRRLREKHARMCHVCGEAS